MKRLLSCAVAAFWAAVLTLLASAALAPQSKPGWVNEQQLAQHDRADDCWMVIEGKVYDVTQYIPSHPTRPQVVTRWCGKEATAVFSGERGGHRHSPAAFDSLEPLFVGRLGAP